FADKRLSEALGRNIEALVNCRIAGLEPDVKLNQWIETVPDSLLKKFVSWGLIDGQRTEITKPLTEQISEYVEVLKAKRYSEGYIRHTRNRLKKTVRDCRFSYFRDVTKTAVEIYIGKLQRDGLSATTAGHYLDSFKTFLNWAEQDQRIIRNPIAKMEKPTRDSEKKGVLEPEQFVHLVKTTSERNVLIGKTSGQERAALYLVAGMTGLRKKELLNLCWNNINLSAENAFVGVKASIAKNGKEVEQPVPTILVSVLTALRASVRPNASDRVFLSISKWINTAELIREDLSVAELELTDREGNEICFHSLRNSYISFLANSQTPAKVVQKLARHSDPRLTFNTYARTFEKAEQKALNFLPDFGNFVFATSLAKLCRKQEISVDNRRHKNRRGAQKTAFLAPRETPRVGLEPTT
ncbi:MAG: tyrosine-type recombinase/integrase, partial [Planctomycetota bacterium]|nr:tyrosine-type recombinase/integrase [Planctomycetota bacterium]